MCVCVCARLVGDTWTLKLPTKQGQQLQTPKRANGVGIGVLFSLHEAGLDWHVQPTMVVVGKHITFLLIVV